MWHVPNGEIRRVGNKSQQWARAILDVTVAYDSDICGGRGGDSRRRRRAGERSRSSVRSIIGPPEVLGVEQITNTRC